MSRLEPLVEIELDSGTLRYSTSGIVSANYYWEPRLVSIGDINREISVLPENFRASDISITLADADQAISKLRREEPFRRRKVKILLGRMDEGESDFETIATGVIESWQARGDQFILRAVDQPIDWLDEVISGYLTDLGTFPTRPDTTGAHLVPILIGKASSPTGALPAYLIDAAAGQANYRYVGAHGDIQSVDAVYRYGVKLAASAYTVLKVNYASQIFTVIDFTADQRDSDRASETEITWDGDGWTSDGTATGSSLTNPADQYQAFLESQGLSVDSASFTEAAAEFTSRNVTGALIFVDRNETLRQVVGRTAQSYNLTTYTLASGAIAVTATGAVRTAPSGTLVEVDEAKVARGGFSLMSSPRLASEIVYRYAYNGVSQGFEKTGLLRDLRQEASLGERIRIDQEMPYVRDATSAAAMVEDKLFFTQEQRAVATIGVDPDVIKEVDVGDFIRVSHFAGLGESGYAKEEMRVLGVGLSFRDQGLVGRLKCVDIVQDLEFTTDFFDYLDYSTPRTYTTLERDPYLATFSNGPVLRL